MSDDIDVNNPQPLIRAKNRRRMAWIALIALLVSATLLMFVVSPERLKALSGLLELYWMSLAAVILGYMGGEIMALKNLSKK
jgi:hypothetical protein